MSNGRNILAILNNEFRNKPASSSFVEGESDVEISGYNIVVAKRKQRNKPGSSEGDVAPITDIEDAVESKSDESDMSNSRSRGEFYLSNRTEFIHFVNERFTKIKNDYKNNNTSKEDSCDTQSSDGSFEIMLHQKLLLSYLTLDSPYRGLLLYHGLGSGKTISSIAIFSECCQRKNDVIVICPLQLIGNYTQEVEKYKRNFGLSDNDLPSIEYFGYTSTKQMENLSKLGKPDKDGKSGFDNKVIIIDEVHSFTNKIVNAMRNKSEAEKSIDEIENNDMNDVTDSSGVSHVIPIYNHMKAATGTRFVLLSGTPVINIPFELAILFNILRGNIVTHRYKLKSDMKEKEWKQLENKIKNQMEVDYFSVKRSNKTPGFNWEVVVTENPKRFINIKSNPFKKVKGVSADRKNPTPFVNRIKSLISQSTKSIRNINHEESTYTAFPEDEATFTNTYAKPILSKNQDNNKRILFQKRILGLASYFKGASDSLMASITESTIELEMSDFQETEFLEQLKIEKKKTKNKKFPKNSTEKVQDSYRVRTRQICDFAPPTIPNPYKVKELFSQIQRMYEQDEDFLKIDANDNNKLGRFSPKYKKVIESVKMKNKGTHLIFSNFVTIGIEIIALSMKRNGFVEMKISKKNNNDITIDNLPEVYKANTKTFIVYRTEDSNGVKLAKRKIFNSDWDELQDKDSNVEDKQVQFGKLKDQLANYKESRQYVGELAIALLISKSASEGISLRNVRYVHILETSWNPSVTTQVIGRARRICSHMDLNEKDRTIEVYKYLMKVNNNIASTDMELNDISNKKQADMDVFLNLVKGAAVDCKVLRDTNKEKNYQCISFQKNISDWSYTPSEGLKEKK